MTRGRDWDPKEHPRWPKGAGDKGGEFRDTGPPGGDWASRISDAMVAPRATALKTARPAKRVPAKTELQVESEKLRKLNARLDAARNRRRNTGASRLRSMKELEIEEEIGKQQRIVDRLQIERAGREPEKVEIPLRGGDTLVVERQVQDEVPAHIREAADRFQRGEISAGQLAAILEGREPAPIPKLTPKAAKFLVEYRTNSRLNAGERIPIQLTREGLVKVRTGKNGLGMKERWLEVTPAGRDVQQLLQNAPPPAKVAPKKAAAPKLRKSLRPGDVVEWTDEEDGTALRGTVRREGRFTMVDWEGGRAEKVSARGTDPSIRKISDASPDYVQPEAVQAPTKVNLDDVMKDAGLTLDHNYTNRSAYKAVRAAREKLHQGDSPKEVAAWLRRQAATLTSEEDDQTSMAQMDRETLRERLKAGKSLLRDLAKALTAHRADRQSDWAQRVDASIGGARSSSHTPVKGRDLTGDIDYAALAPRAAGQAPFIYGPRGSDPALGDIAAQQGFDGLPELLSTDEMDARVAAGWVETWRGVDGSSGSMTTEQLAEAFRTGAYWPGQGVFGNGTYGAVSMEQALGYAGGWRGGSDERPAGLIRMAISPDARIIDYDELIAMMEPVSRDEQGRRKVDWGATLPDNPQDLVMMDAGRFAAAHGYDAIAAQPRNPSMRDGRIMYYTILNRTALAVETARG